MAKLHFQATAKAAPDDTKPWSAEQRAIFAECATGKQHLIIEAVAGSGKTTTICEGVVRAHESEIWLATFGKVNNIDLTAKNRAPNATVRTMHSVGMACVKRRFPDAPVDDERKYRLAAQALENKAPIKAHPLAPDLLDKVVSWAAEAPRTTRETISHVARIYTQIREVCAKLPSHADVMEIIDEYDLAVEADWPLVGWTDERCAAYALIAIDIGLAFADLCFDVTDMIWLPLMKGWTYPRFDLIVVDEAQDLNEPLLAFAMKMVSRGGRIVIVGDDRQGIYQFRGATSGTLDKLAKTLGAKRMTLTTCYRCPQEVVKAAQRIVPSIRAAASAPPGVIGRLRRPQLADRVREGDMVLSRSNAPLLSAGIEAINSGRRVMVVGKDIGDHLTKLIRKVCHPDARMYIPDFLKAIDDYTKDQTDSTSDRPSAKARLARLIDLLEALKQFAKAYDAVNPGRSTTDLTKQIIELFTEKDPKLTVRFSTIHKAKGLEAPRVFILENTLYRGSRERNGHVVEEQNCEYVAITRAMRELYWVEDDKEVEYFANRKG